MFMFCTLGYAFLNKYTNINCLAEDIKHNFLPCFDDGCGKFQVEIATSRPWGSDSLPEITRVRMLPRNSKGFRNNTLKVL